MSLNLNYTLDNELKTRPGELPSGIQTQAFQIALTHISRRLETIKAMVNQKVPGAGANAFSGLAPAWRQRLATQTQFLNALPARLMDVAQQIALGDMGDAIAQRTSPKLWNRWAPAALETYADSLKAFQGEVSRALSNKPAHGMPAAYAKMANLAKMDAPLMPTADALGQIDPDYLAQLDPDYLAGAPAMWDLNQEMADFTMQDGSTLFVGAGLLGLAWWFFRPRGGFYVEAPRAGAYVAYGRRSW